MYDTQITVNGIVYNVYVYHNGWDWSAIEENYDGPEDRYRTAGGKTRQEAIDSLIENLEEMQERDAERAERKLFRFSNGNHTVELTAKNYTEAAEYVPYGYNLSTITK